MANLPKMKIFLKAKQYKLGRKINANTIKHLRQSISSDAQGAFITTADFQSKANYTALENDFSRIGLINGSQLVDLLVAHWGMRSPWPQRTQVSLPTMKFTRVFRLRPLLVTARGDGLLRAPNKKPAIPCEVRVYKLWCARRDSNPCFWPRAF